MGPYQENKVDRILNIVTFSGRVRMGIITKKFDILTKFFGHRFEDSMLIVTPIMGVCNCSMFCCVLLCVHSSIAIISVGKRERAGCLALFVFLVSRDCCVALPHDVMGLSVVCDCGIS